MADIELVIKLDEEYIKQIDRIRFLIGGIEDRSLQVNVINAIKNGTPLPKGHGRLKDVDNIFSYSEDLYEAIDCAPTIIEADKESKNEMKDFIRQICSDILDEAIIAELESLKAKIDNPKTCMFAGTYEADWIMENIIDKRMEELKRG